MGHTGPFNSLGPTSSAIVQHLGPLPYLIQPPVGIFPLANTFYLFWSSPGFQHSLCWFLCLNLCHLGLTIPARS